MTPQPLLTAKEVGAILAISAKAVIRLVKAGRLDGVKVLDSQKGWRFEPEAVSRFIAAYRTAVTARPYHRVFGS